MPDTVQASEFFEFLELLIHTSTVHSRLIRRRINRESQQTSSPGELNREANFFANECKKSKISPLRGESSSTMPKSDVFGELTRETFQKNIAASRRIKLRNQNNT